MNFLVVAQLPPLLCHWIENTFDHQARHVSSLEKGLKSSDNRIWEVALRSGEVIISKDFDFYDRVLVSDQSPSILHLNLGNCSNKELINYLDQNWNPIIEAFHNHYTLVSISQNEIECW